MLYEQKYMSIIGKLWMFFVFLVLTIPTVWLSLAMFHDIFAGQMDPLVKRRELLICIGFFVGFFWYKYKTDSWSYD